MDGSKAPMLDGFSMLFYQECWETIKTDLMGDFKEFFHRGEMCKFVKLTFIVLVPKKEDVSSLSDYRPINLVSSLQKIILKVLVIWLRGIMGWVVSSTQSTFIQGRQIIDSILIANECVDVRRKGREKGVVCKLDMEKAYDKVN